MKNEKFRRNNYGFTLVELVIVIVILVILATIIVPSLTKYFQSTKLEKIKDQAKSIFQSSGVMFYNFYSDFSHSDRSDCVISGNKNNTVSTVNCMECDIHNNTISKQIMERAGLKMNSDEPCIVVLGLGRYDKYAADPCSSDYDPIKAYTVYLVIYQEIFKKTVYYYLNDGELYSKWPFEGDIDRNNIIVDGVDVQLYYIKNGKDNKPGDSAQTMWKDHISKYTVK